VTSPSTTSGPRSAERAIGSGPVHSWDEFSRLREVIVGDISNARIPSVDDRSAWLNLFPELDRRAVADAGTPTLSRRVVEETAEDLSLLVRALEQAGVTVRRPAPVDHAAEFGAPGWRSRGMYAYCPRDLALVLGETLVETPTPTRARYFESLGLHPLFREYLHAGTRWISAPRSALADVLYDVGHDERVRLTEAEVAFEAANVLRVGRDLIYQVSTSGNELGLTWLTSVLPLLGDLRVHPLRGVYEFTHIDSTIAPLRPGLVLLNPERITPDAIPPCFRGWDVRWCPPPPDGNRSGPALSSPWIAMNLLMVDVDLAVVDAGHPALLRLLERAGVAVIPLRLRHARTLGGGFHCVTLDVRRDGALQDYTV
jgi:glycine amidinotransferase